MNNKVKLAVVATGAVALGYETLSYGINQCVEKYVPEPVAKYVTPVVTVSVVAAAVGAGLSYAGTGAAATAISAGSTLGGRTATASSLVMNPSSDSIADQIIKLGKDIGTLVLSSSIHALSQLEFKGDIEVLGYVSDEGYNIATVTYKFYPS